MGGSGGKGLTLAPLPANRATPQHHTSYPKFAKHAKRIVLPVEDCVAELGYSVSKFSK